jgi:hypothetical protein
MHNIWNLIRTLNKEMEGEQVELRMGMDENSGLYYAKLVDPDGAGQSLYHPNDGDTNLHAVAKTPEYALEQLDNICVFTP